MTTLARIRTKVRRLTASASSLQLTDAQIDEYVNDFYLMDLPSYLKLFDLHETYTFYTDPNIDTYALNVNPSYTSLTPRAYYSVEPPVFVSGYEAMYTQSRTEFFRMYPLTNSEDTIQGSVIAGPYAITLTNTPVLRNNVTIGVTDSGGNQLTATDDGLGSFTGDVTAGAINYLTGAITGLTFTAIIPATSTITIHTSPYVASRPNTVLFYNDEFTLRPVPDKTYSVRLNAYVYPTALLHASSSPEEEYLWQLLAVGAAKKIFEDRGDMESVQTLMPLLNEQMNLSQRRTLEQNRPLRASTIYSSTDGFSGNLNFNNF